MKGAVMFAVLALMTACVSVDMPDAGDIGKSMYNVQESGVSEFDGTQYVRMRNISCPSDANTIMFDLYQDNKMAANGVAILTLKVIGAHSIGDGHSLHFNIDGWVMDLESIDKVSSQKQVFPGVSSPGYAGGGTYISPMYSPATYAATKRYRLMRRVIEMIGDADRVVVRADLAQEHTDGVCSPRAGSEVADKEYPWSKDLVGTVGFKRFAEMIKTFDRVGSVN